MVEGRVRPTDVDNVYPGQVARLRFSAFKQRTTPQVLGRVERVSPDAFLNEETRGTYYVVRIRVPEEELAKLGEVKIRPGMPVAIMIMGGQRTALQYLSDPLTEHPGEGIGGRSRHEMSHGSVDRCLGCGIRGRSGCLLLAGRTLPSLLEWFCVRYCLRSLVWPDRPPLAAEWKPIHYQMRSSMRWRVMRAYKRHRDVSSRLGCVERKC